MQREYTHNTREPRYQHSEIFETDRLLQHPYHQHPLEYLAENPDTSLEDFIARFASSTLQDSPSTSVDMTRPPTIAQKNAQRGLWHPFPEAAHEVFTGDLDPAYQDIFMPDWEHLPGRPPIIFAAPRTADGQQLLTLDPLAPQLAELDKVFYATEQRRMDDVVAEQCRDDGRIRGALDILSDYADARTGFVRCLGRRLEAVQGLRNERPFDLPKVGARTFNKSSGLLEYPQHFYDIFPVYSEKEKLQAAKALMVGRQLDLERVLEHGNNGVGDDTQCDKCNTQQAQNTVESRSSSKTRVENKTPAGSPTKVPPPRSAIEALFRDNFAAKIEAERSAAMQARFTTPPSRTRSQHPLSPAVDRVTGAGLREFLIHKTREGLVRKRDCNSITFCDFTQHLSDAWWHNRDLLGHWTANREKGHRIEVYEVDLPTTVMNPKTGREEPRDQTWIWILMSRPVVSFSATETATKIVITPPKPTTYTNAYDAKRAALAALPKPAPTFPNPIPTSWVAFACPLENVTEFSEVVEEVSISPATRMVPSWKYSNLRQDYDFSHAGIPIFEHSSVEFISKLYPNGHAPKDGTRFLSVENLGGYDPYDYCGHLSAQVYLDKLSDREESPEKYEKNEYGEPREAPCGLQSPKSGIWWEEFFKGVDNDKKAWEKIRNSMGRGKCRVSVRWSETESMRTTEVDLESCEMREISPSSPKSSKGNAKRRKDSEGASTRSKKAAKTGAQSKKRSQISSEVMTTSPGGLPTADTVKTTTGSPEKPKRKPRKRAQ